MTLYIISIILFFFPWRWKQNGTDIDFTMSYHYRLDGGSLAINSPHTDQDIGMYQCLATNLLGTILSRKAKLQFACEFGVNFLIFVSENIIFFWYTHFKNLALPIMYLRMNMTLWAFDNVHFVNLDSWV